MGADVSCAEKTRDQCVAERTKKGRGRQAPGEPLLAPKAPPAGLGVWGSSSPAIPISSGGGSAGPRQPPPGWIDGVAKSLWGGAAEKRALSASALVTQKSSKQDRMDRYIDAAAATADRLSPQVAGCLRAFKPLMVGLIRFLMIVVPLYRQLYSMAYDVLSVLPLNVLSMIFGITLCFFGGSYTASIAAIEAFRTMGGETTLEDLKYVVAQINMVSAAHEEDNKLDLNRDGIADVDQMTPSELAEHKLKLAMRAVDEPEKLQAAVGSLWAACLAVFATLRLQFARTVALALGIVELCKFPVLRLLVPIVAWALGEELKHWVETIIDSALKIVCIIFAWWLQSIISAFYSGLRGGKMFAAGAFSIMQERGWLQQLPDCLVPDKEPFNPDTTYVDEMIAYPIAALGFCFQISTNFETPFPLNIVLLPLTILEWVLRFAIVFSDDSLL